MGVISKRIILLLVILLSGCSQEDNLRDQFSNWDPYHYRVQPGDTLYSIAWRYDLDFRDIAHWNNIKEPYTIFPGQQLDMKQPQPVNENKTYLFGQAEANMPEQKDDQVSTAKDTSVPENQNETMLSEAPDYSDPSNIPAPPPVNSASGSYIPPAKTHRPQKSRPQQQAALKTQPPAKSVAGNNVKRPDTLVPAIKKTGKLSWAWPLKGKLFSTFAANNHDRKGIDIVGRKGQQVKAAEQGVVVYSGAGLISYGNLVIIKHNDRYLSAYAHNKKLLVREGEAVKRGQAIAVIGKKSNVTNLLHFEIRKDGKPVNPLVYLP